MRSIYLEFMADLDWQKLALSGVRRRILEFRVWSIPWVLRFNLAFYLCFSAMLPFAVADANREMWQTRPLEAVLNVLFSVVLAGAFAAASLYGFYATWTSNRSPDPLGE